MRLLLNHKIQRIVTICYLVELLNEDKQILIMYLYIFCRPPEVEWVRLHVVKSIMLALRIPDGSFGAVKDCLKIIEEQIKQNPNKSFNSAGTFNSAGEYRYANKVTGDSPEMAVATDNRGSSCCKYV